MQTAEELPDYQYEENENEENKQTDGAAKYVPTLP